MHKGNVNFSKMQIEMTGLFIRRHLGNVNAENCLFRKQWAVTLNVITAFTALSSIWEELKLLSRRIVCNALKHMPVMLIQANITLVGSGLHTCLLNVAITALFTLFISHFCFLNMSKDGLSSLWGYFSVILSAKS